jgi:pimeloyl-ACP methyl ester carboxylesterase
MLNYSTLAIDIPLLILPLLSSSQLIAFHALALRLALPFIHVALFGSKSKRWTTTLFLTLIAATASLHSAIQLALPSSPSLDSYVLPFLLVLADRVLPLAGVFAALFVFPPLGLLPPTGPHHVGVVDTFFKRPKQPQSPATTNNLSHLTVRVLYPSSEPCQTPIPFLSLGSKICDLFVQFGAPPFLKSAGWMLNGWLLITLPFRRNGSLMTNEKDRKLPVVIYSHGLSGCNALYSAQAGNLASHGYVVFQIEHRDGSPPLTIDELGNEIEFNQAIYEKIETLEDGSKLEGEAYVSGRREQLEIRIAEVLDLAKIITSGRGSEKSISFLRDKLDLKAGIHLIGHSMGGATVLGASGRESHRFRSVIVHDPAVDWVPDDVRCEIQAGGCSWLGTGGYAKGSETVPTNGLSKLPMQWLYSSKWVEIKYGHSFHTIPRINEGHLGLKPRSEAFALEDSMHFEFSDNCLILPFWLCRLLCMSGEDPEGKCKDVRRETLAFLNNN